MDEFNITGQGKVSTGRYTQIGEGAQIVFIKPGKVTIGDYCNIGPGVKIVCSGGDVEIGDWTTLHDNCLVLSTQYAYIGEHCWFGQNCVIDGSGGLKIGQGVRVGMYSQIWSHVAAGEQIEGCTLYGERAVVIEDNVWLVGSCIVASGVTLGTRVVALIGSNITKSFLGGSVIAGTPAALKPGLSFYRDITLDEKWALLLNWMGEAANELELTVTPEGDDRLFVHAINSSNDSIAFVKKTATATALRNEHPALTVCCIEDKTYNKQLNSTERQVLKYLAGNKARFHAIAQHARLSPETVG